MTEGTPESDLSLVTHSGDDSVHISAETAEVTVTDDGAAHLLDVAETAPDDAVTEPDAIPGDAVELPAETVGSQPVEPAPAIESEVSSVAGAANEAEKDTGAAGAEAQREAAPKPDKRPNRKLGWRAYILGGSGGTK